jgi:hypothetical protein
VKSIFAILFLSLNIVINVQQSSPVRNLNPSAESRVQEILKSLEPDNTLRFSLERGTRGNGIHYAWMDTMQRYGIKQASFVVSFKWKDGVLSLKIKNVSFLRHYYRYDTRIKDRKLLQQFRRLGLEQEVRDAILMRAKADLAQRMKNQRRANGTLYLNLLDDEALPILDEMPTIEG